MIQFACKECGRLFERPAEQAGTLVFCECGTANRVPWETAPADVPLPVLPVETVGAEIPDALAVEDVPEGQAQLDRDHCFNHPKIAAQQPCSECGEIFCADCLVSLQGQILCGPCKNFRLRLLQRPTRLSLLALFSFIVALLTGPMSLFCLNLSGVAKSPGILLAGLVVPLLALLLGILGLRDIETKPRRSGRSLAISGIVTALVSSFLTIVFVILLAHSME